jgi:hypothetical protein
VQGTQEEENAPNSKPTIYRDPKTGQLSFVEPAPLSNKGSNNPNTQSAALKGTRLHLDKSGNLPEQLRERYPETEFSFKQQGAEGQDVAVVGGKHPSEYPGSHWPEGVDHADFKPNTPGGRKTFASDQRHKWPEPTFMLTYDPLTGELLG